ncbi:ribosomal protein S18 acetylase RimI-like enzyme [Stackebrandtia albiflava]|uniref:Ribosomal protein S18 acetylase RimI-like enzyme n=1 Tax=Stackebrandtia albiflava TaxID=406432 RepID=A0A562VGZ0_9ACTN|nr:GNAT family N-acetyltransferase [Stackebrandtia albiflava]TWJ17163.1 ribosomal protein S18 acetylase RimI-like enzyme [Stackebrandtia albiflava]
MALGYVRPATADDAERIAAIQLTTWRTAYRDIVPADVLAGMDETWLAERWRAACAEPPSPAHRVFTAVEQAESDHRRIQTVGFIAVGPDEDADAEAVPGAGMVTELLVEPRFGRRGHGSRLLSAAVAHWRSHGITVAYAWSFARDAATLGFYKSAGWDADGARRTLEMADRRVPQLRLHADVTGDDDTA